MNRRTSHAFADELSKIHSGELEKTAVRETLRIGRKALSAALRGGTKLHAPPGVFKAERDAAVTAGTGLMEALKRRGVTTHRARVKSPGSIMANGGSGLPDDLLGMQTYGKGPEDVKKLLSALRSEGVTGISASTKARKGYHGVNIKGSYKGTPIEYQVSPGRISNMGQIMEHSLGYKQVTEAPNANRIDKWVGRVIAPKMVNWDAAGPLDPSWINEAAPAMRRFGVK